MTLSLPAAAVRLLNADTTVKLLATTDAQGIPHVVAKQSLHLGTDGRIHYLEQLETSQSNRNLVRAIWFDRTVAIALIGANGENWQIKGRPVKAHVTGPLFLEHYRALRQQDPDADLAAVWVIAPAEAIDQSLCRRRQEERQRHPHFVHLDRLARA